MTTQRALLFGLFTAITCLYLYTLDTGLRPDELNGGDLITHQYAQVEARPSNAPGYPLYTMGGWLWFHLSRPVLSPFFNPTQILSMYSLGWGLAALGCLYLILRRLARFEIALSLTAFHATTYFFWYYSVTTEQYTSAVFQTLLMVWFALKFEAQPRPRWLLAMACLSGTMLANMLTTLFILPPILGFILACPQEGDKPHKWLMVRNLMHYLRQPRLIAQILAVTILPVLSYGYVYIRGAQHPEWRGVGQWDSAWAWFLQFVTIQQGRDELAPGLGWQHFFTSEFPALMWQDLTPFVFFGGLIGLARLNRRQAILFYATLAIYLMFCWAYRFGNWFQVIIPAYPLFTLGFAVLLETSLKQFQLKYQTLGVRVALGLLILYSLLAHFPRANQRYRPDDLGLEPGYALLADQPTPPAWLYASFEERVAWQYLQTMGGLGQEIHLMTTLPAPTGRVYASRQALTTQPELLQNVHPQAVGGQLIQLAPDPMLQLPATAHPTSLQFGEALTLVGWESRPTALWHMTLYWQATQPISQNYTISVRPKLPTAAPFIQDHQPVWGFYPTRQWQPLEIVSDVYTWPLPHDPETVEIVVYYTTEAGFENVGVGEIKVRE